MTQDQVVERSGRRGVFISPNSIFDQNKKEYQSGIELKHPSGRSVVVVSEIQRTCLQAEKPFQVASELIRHQRIYSADPVCIFLPDMDGDDFSELNELMIQVMGEVSGSHNPRKTIYLMGSEFLDPTVAGGIIEKFLETGEILIGPKAHA